MDWTAKYRPTSLDDVRGNDEAIRELRKWADNWQSHQDAVILHGRPGVGKTTAAHALANDNGWESMEMNASEQRTKDVVGRIAGGAANNGTIQAGGAGRRLVVLDEADSLHGNVDRGGTGAMTDVVKEAQQPVVLIANDFYEMSNGLRNACQDIEFDLVDESAIARFLRDICESEGIDYTRDALKTLAADADGDVRGAVNDLQAVAMSLGDEALTVDDLSTGSRDREENIFAFLDTVLKEGTPEVAMRAARDVDETPDDLIQWIEDNIVQEYNPRELDSAYDSLARSDVWLGRVYSGDHNYKYWKYASGLMTAGVAESRSGRHSGWTRWGPPSFWQKLGSTRSKRDTRDAAAQAIGQNARVSMSVAKNDVLPFLSAITHHCKNRDATVAMAATLDFDAETVSFVTGSGESTNKVQDIVADAAEKRGPELSGGEGSGTGLHEFMNGGDDSDAVANEEADSGIETEQGSDGSNHGDGDTTQTTLF